MVNRPIKILRPVMFLIRNSKIYIIEEKNKHGIKVKQKKN